MDEVLLHETFRPMAPRAATLLPNEVHVWAVPMAGDSERFAAWLSPDEQQRAQRFRFADHGRRYTIAHGALRTILAGYVSAEPGALEFLTGARGKPSLVGAGMPQFNLTHSAQLAMLAVARVPVGIDVEKMRHLERLHDIAQRQFSTAEFAALDALPQAERLAAFYRCWTRKEAYVKALGVGLTALDVFDVDIGECAQLLALRDGQDVLRWSMFDVSPALEYTGGLAVQDQGTSVRRFALRDV